MKQKKKVAAAIAAVMNYIYEETAVAVPVDSPQEVSALDKTHSMNLNLWGHSGRHEMMQIRTLMQMRAFKGTRL